MSNQSKLILMTRLTRFIIIITVPAMHSNGRQTVITSWLLIFGSFFIKALNLGDLKLHITKKVHFRNDRGGLSIILNNLVKLRINNRFFVCQLLCRNHYFIYFSLKKVPTIYKLKSTYLLLMCYIALFTIHILN